eukprot:TRINITY_DN121818_c0_g1_i1.p1 TRINITY_DN121818_c0_g1~~TRINITY_DN121818_c0_g1_i1.p1  ORF type:complete len:330 (-),score=48.27 TRINITY_DN121818_c0_g1_i1:144-1133(-)
MLISMHVMKWLCKICVAIVLFGVGLSTDVAEVVRLIKTPLLKRGSLSLATLITILGVFFIQPLVAMWLHGRLSDCVETKLAMLLISFSPGGPASNTFALMGGATHTLNLVATSMTSLLFVPMLPILVEMYFARELRGRLDYSGLLISCVLILLPLLLGLSVRSCGKRLTKRLERVLGAVGSVLLVGVAVAAGLPPTFESAICPVLLASFAFLLGGIGGVVLHLELEGIVSMSLEWAIHDVPLAAMVLLTAFDVSDGTVKSIAALMIYGWTTLLVGLAMTSALMLWRRWHARDVSLQAPQQPKDQADKHVQMPGDENTREEAAEACEEQV